MNDSDKNYILTHTINDDTSLSLYLLEFSLLNLDLLYIDEQKVNYFYLPSTTLNGTNYYIKRNGLTGLPIPLGLDELHLIDTTNIHNFVPQWAGILEESFKDALKDSSSPSKKRNFKLISLIYNLQYNLNRSESNSVTTVSEIIKKEILE